MTLATTNCSASSVYQDSVPARSAATASAPVTALGVAGRPRTCCSIWGAAPGAREANSCSRAIRWATPPSLGSSLSPLMTGRKVAEDTLESSGDSNTPKTCRKETGPRVRGAWISTPTQMWPQLLFSWAWWVGNKPCSDKVGGGGGDLPPPSALLPPPSSESSCPAGLDT